MTSSGHSFRELPIDVQVRQEFAEAVRARREAIGLSQADLATLADVSGGTIKTAEAGSAGLASRSRRGIILALGWKAPPEGEFGYNVPRAVLDADSVRAVADAVLPFFRGDGHAGKTNVAMRFRLEYNALVAALSESVPTVSPGFYILRELMQTHLPPGQLQKFDEDLHHRIGGDYPLVQSGVYMEREGAAIFLDEGFGIGHGSHGDGPAKPPRGKAGTVGAAHEFPTTNKGMEEGLGAALKFIFNTNLPASTKEMLLQHAASRREQLYGKVDEIVHDEIRTLVRHLQHQMTTYTFAEGRAVRHPRFGEGHILEVTWRGNSTKARVEFGDRIEWLGLSGLEVIDSNERPT